MKLYSVKLYFKSGLYIILNFKETFPAVRAPKNICSLLYFLKYQIHNCSDVRFKNFERSKLFNILGNFQFPIFVKHIKHSKWTATTRRVWKTVLPSENLWLFEKVITLSIFPWEHAKAKLQILWIFGLLLVLFPHEYSKLRPQNNEVPLSFKSCGKRIESILSVSKYSLI